MLQWVARKSSLLLSSKIPAYHILADALKDAAIKVVGNEADRSLHQHICALADRALEYSKHSSNLRMKYC